MVSYQKGPTRHANAWQIGPFWQDTLDMSDAPISLYPRCGVAVMRYSVVINVRKLTDHI